MIITSAQYTKSVMVKDINASIKATIDGKNWSVPLDPDNIHYAEILRQVKEEGLTIKEAK